MQFDYISREMNAFKSFDFDIISADAVMQFPIVDPIIVSKSRIASQHE